MNTSPAEAVIGADGIARCPWAASHPVNQAYHDREWGVPIEGESAYLERLTLEAFQSGLSWLTILNKRDNFRAAFVGFDADVIATWGLTEVERLMGDAGIVRNRRKIEATLTNAQATVALREHGGLEAFVNSFIPQRDVTPQSQTTSAESTALAKALKKQGFAFTGPTTMYALMEAIGLFDPHVPRCHRRGSGGARRWPGVNEESGGAG